MFQMLKSFCLLMVMVTMLSVGAFAQTKDATAAEEGKDAAKTTKVEFQPETIEKAQQALKTKGLYKGEATGKLDAPTKDAIKEFQKQAGLNPTGRLNKDTRQKLGIEAAEVKESKPKDTTKSKSKKSTKTSDEEGK